MFAWRDNYISYAGSSAPATDPYWSSVVLLSNFETPQTMFKDYSPNNLVVTGTNPSTFPILVSPYSGNPNNSLRTTVNYNDGLSVPYSSSFDLGTQSFTAECWAYFVALPTGTSDVMVVNQIGTAGYAGIRINVNSLGAVSFLCAATSVSWINSSTTANGTISAGTWYHMAAVRNGTSFVLYINGVSSLTYTSSTSINNGSGNTTLGAFNPAATGSGRMNGYLSDFRVVVGSAVYNTGFTPPTTPLTAVSNTQVLLSMVNLGTNTNSPNNVPDLSSNGFECTVTGTMYYNGNSPFGNSIPGSMNFTGATYIVAQDSDAFYFTGDFTIEFWFYSTTTSGDRSVVSQWPGVSAINCAWSATISTGNRLRFVYGIGASNVAVVGTTQTFVNNQWNHVAFTRQGTTLRMFLNGVQDASTFTVSGALNNSTAAPNIGRQGDNSSFCTGYISNVRVIKGTSLYNSDFTVPTTPLTNVSGTSLLVRLQEAGAYNLSTNFTNYGIAGSPTTSVQQAKFGTQSLYAPASATLVALNNTGLQLGTSDFTIECWIYKTTTGGITNIMYKANAAGGTGWTLQVNASNQLVWIALSVTLKTSTTTISANTWTYVAITRSGTTGYMFINGTLEGSSFTDSTNYSQTNNLFLASPSNSLVGYMDDVRITKGVCRYTASFTAPTSSFPTS